MHAETSLLPCPSGAAGTGGEEREADVKLWARRRGASPPAGAAVRHMRGAGPPSKDARAQLRRHPAVSGSRRGHQSKHARREARATTHPAAGGCEFPSVRPPARAGTGWGWRIAYIDWRERHVPPRSPLARARRCSPVLTGKAHHHFIKPFLFRLEHQISHILKYCNMCFSVINFQADNITTVDLEPGIKGMSASSKFLVC